MINIEITPATRVTDGVYLAVGHAGAGRELICNSVSVIEECLCANLDNTWNIRVYRSLDKGHYELRWRKTDRRGDGLRRANEAAGFAYTGLKALAKKYPDEVAVKWLRANGLPHHKKEERKCTITQQ